MADEAGTVPDEAGAAGNDSGVPEVAGGDGAATASGAGEDDAGAEAPPDEEPVEGTDEFGGEVLEGEMGAESLRSKMYTLQQKELNAVRPGRRPGRGGGGRPPRPATDAALRSDGRQGVIDEQFTQLKQLEDDSNPEFVKEVLEMYLSDSRSRLERMDEILYVAARAPSPPAVSSGGGGDAADERPRARPPAAAGRRTSRTTASSRAWCTR